LDYEDGDEIPPEVEGRIPKYNCIRQIGISLIHKLDCYECYICGRFFDTERTSEIHTRTVTHHRNFVKFLNEKANDTKISQKRAAAALEEAERKKKKLEAATEAEKNGEKKDGDETYDPTEATGDDDEKKDGDVAMESQDEDETTAAAADDVEENGESVAVEAAAAVLDEIKQEEEVATPTKRVQRARGRGRNAKL